MEIEKDALVFDDTNENLEYTGERYVPKGTSDEMTIEHTQRYLFAKEFANNKIILDAACGEGYGSHILSKEANKIYAIDIDKETINKARKKYQQDNIEFISSSIERLPFGDEMFDLSISFETIEHVNENIQKSFLEEVNRTLKKDGIFIISTPNKRIYSDKVETKNPYHKKEFYRAEFQEFLGKHFEHIYMFDQHFRLGYFLNQEGKENSVEMDSINAEEARYYIAVCSHCELQIDMEKSFEVFDNSMYFELFKNCNKLYKEITILNSDFKEFRHNSKEYINHIENDIKRLQEALIKKDEDTLLLNSVITNRDKDIEELKSVITHRDRDIKELKSVIDELRNQNESLKEGIEHPIKSILKKLCKRTKI